MAPVAIAMVTPRAVEDVGLGVALGARGVDLSGARVHLGPNTPVRLLVGLKCGRWGDDYLDAYERTAVDDASKKEAHSHTVDVWHVLTERTLTCYVGDVPSEESKQVR